MQGASASWLWLAPKIEGQQTHGYPVSQEVTSALCKGTVPRWEVWSLLGEVEALVTGSDGFEAKSHSHAFSRTLARGTPVSAH